MLTSLTQCRTGERYRFFGPGGGGEEGKGGAGEGREGGGRYACGEQCYNFHNYFAVALSVER